VIIQQNLEQNPRRKFRVIQGTMMPHSRQFSEQITSKYFQLMTAQVGVVYAA